MAADPETSSEVANPQVRRGRRENRARTPRRRGMTHRVGTRPFAHWLSPPGVAILLLTVLALGIRLFTLTRTGFLTGVAEYDDGVYLGGAIRLTQGALPYRD